MGGEDLGEEKMRRRQPSNKDKQDPRVSQIKQTQNCQVVQQVWVLKVFLPGTWLG